MTSSTRRAAPLCAPPVLKRSMVVQTIENRLNIEAYTCWRMCDAQLVPWESCATTECIYPVGADDHIGPSRSASQPVVAADHSGQSRSAIAGTSDYQNGRRLHRPSKTVRISKRIRAGACGHAPLRRMYDAQLVPWESCATTGAYGNALSSKQTPPPPAAVPLPLEGEVLGRHGCCFFTFFQRRSLCPNRSDC